MLHKFKANRRFVVWLGKAGAFGIEVQRGGAIGHFVPLARDAQGSSARVLLRLGHGVALRPVEKILGGARLHDTGRRAFDAHGKTVAVRHPAAHREAGREGILGHPDGLPGALFFEAAQSDVGILLERSLDGLPQRHGAHFGAQQACQCQGRGCNLTHTSL